MLTLMELCSNLVVLRLFGKGCNRMVNMNGIEFKLLSWCRRCNVCYIRINFTVVLLSVGVRMLHNDYSTFVCACRLYVCYIMIILLWSVSVGVRMLHNDYSTFVCACRCTYVGW